MRLQSNIAIILVVWIVSIAAVAYLGFSYFPHPQTLFLQSWANFDGGHYLSIAQHGYLTKQQYAFFPLYPMLINLIARLTGDYLIAGLLISLVSLLLVLNLFYSLINFDFGKKFAEIGILLLLLFPTAFYLLSVYTESLFLFLSLATFLAMKKKNFLLATITAALASATRITGIPLVLSFLTFVHLSEGLGKKNWYVFLAPAGLAAYCIYLFNVTGDPFYFAKAQLSWHHYLVVPGASLVFLAKKLLDPQFVVSSFRDVLDFVLVVFGIVMVWRMFKKMSLEYTVFSFFSIIMPLFSPTVAPMPRYILSIFPIFIVLTLEKGKYVWVYRMIAPLLLAIFTTLFVTRTWGV